MSKAHKFIKPQWLTISAASEYCSVGPPTIREFLRNGLPCSRVNRKVLLIATEDLDRFLRGFQESDDNVSKVLGETLREFGMPSPRTPLR
jgi:hypothetical protein